MSGSNSHEISPSHTPISSRNAPKFGTLVPNRVFVGGIHTDTSESELYDLFSTYGNVISTKIIADRAGVSKGYGFVTFETEEEARKIQNEESIILKERKLNVAPAIKKQQPFPRMYGTDINSPDSCSSIEPSDSPLVRSANANDWSAINNVNPAEPLSNNGMYYNSGIPLTYPGVYNYVPSADPNQYPQQPYVWYSPVYIPHQPYQTQATPQLHWGGAAIRWPNQVGYEQPNSSPPTSSVPTSTTQSAHYAYSSAPSTPNSTISNSGPKNNLVSSTNNAPSKNLSEKSGVYYALPPSAYTFQMPMQYAMAPPQGMGDNNETAGAESVPVDLTPYNQGSYPKGGARRQSSNFSPRKGPSSFLPTHSYNNGNNYRHYSPQRNYKPRYNDLNVPSHHYVDGKFTLGNHSGPLTPPATPMMTNKGATNGNDHATDTAHRFKNLKLRD